MSTLHCILNDPLQHCLSFLSVRDAARLALTCKDLFSRKHIFNAGLLDYVVSVSHQQILENDKTAMMQTNHPLKQHVSCLTNKEWRCVFLRLYCYDNMLCRNCFRNTRTQVSFIFGQNVPEISFVTGMIWIGCGIDGGVE